MSRRIRAKFAATSVDGHDVLNLFKLLIPAGNPKFKNIEALYCTGKLPNCHVANPEPFLDRSKPPIREPIVVCHLCVFFALRGRLQGVRSTAPLCKVQEYEHLGSVYIRSARYIGNESQYETDLPNTPPPKKIKIHDDLSKTTESPCYQHNCQYSNLY